MKIELPWGPDMLTVPVPDTWNIIFPEKKPSITRAAQKDISIVKKSLANPTGTGPLHKMKLGGKKILIIIDDNTRPTPIHRFFSIILDNLKKAGASTKNITVIPALGIHTPMTEKEMEEKIGSENLKKINWENHDAFSEEHHFFGTTSRKTPVFLNSRVKESDLIITIGLVEPHLWAGFGGGLKNILPGLASAETIGRHHEIIAEPPYRFNRVGVMPEENSFRLDLEEIDDMISAPVFCINVVIDHNRDIIASFAGDPISVHRQAVELNYNELGLRLEKKVDGIITNSCPMDINFKQGMKCVGNSLPALKAGGAVMGFLKAEKGVDDIPLPDKATPLWLVRRILRILGPSRVYGFMERVKAGMNVEEKFLTYYGMNLIRQYYLFLYVPTLSAEEARLLGIFTQCRDPEEVIARGIKKIGTRATVAVFPEGGATFPVLG